VFSKVSESNARYNVMDRMIVAIHSVKMPVGFGKTAVKSKGRTLSVMAHVKHSIIEVKTDTDCLALAIIIAIARLTKDPSYKSYAWDIRFVQRYNIYCKQRESICRTVEVSLKSSDSKTTFQSTKLLFMEDWIVRI